MRDALRKLLDEAEQSHAKSPEVFAMVHARAQSPRVSGMSLTLSAAGSLGVLLVLGLAALKLTEPPPRVSHEATNLHGQSLDNGPDTAALLGMCRSFSDPDGNVLDWGRAVDACQKALTADPINVDARKLKKLSEKELAQKSIFDDAHRLFDLGEEGDAMDQYLRIDSDSFYYRQARSEFRKAAPAAMKHAGDLCVSEWKAYEWEKAWPDCKRMMDVADYLGTDASVQAQGFKHAFDEVKQHQRGKDQWAHRADYGRFLAETTTTGAMERERFEAIKKMYADPELAKAVEQYSRDPNFGMQAIQRYLGKGGRDVAQAKEAYRHMEQMSGAHQSGYESMLAFNLKHAAVEFHVQLDADAKVMPPGFESDLCKQTRRDISEAFAKRGKELFQEGRLPDSFEMCVGGGQFQLGNPSVLECFSDLENKAASLVDQGCAGAAKAAQLTRKDSPTHKKATDFMKNNGC